MAALLFWLCVGMILYTYLGYPALLAILARLRPPPVGAKLSPPAPSSQDTTLRPPYITLLIAAYNEEAVIARKLENSLALDYPPDRLQIIVAADGSDDQTPAIVTDFISSLQPPSPAAPIPPTLKPPSSAAVELLYQPQRRGKMAAINRAMQQARGEVVVFSDANNAYAPDTLRHLVAPFADPRVGAVSGAKTIEKGDGALGESEGLYWKYESFIKKQETRLGSCTGVSGEILAVRRQLYSPPPERIINDDFCIAMQVVRQGYRVAYAPQARSFERVSPSAQDEVVRRSRMIAGRYQAIFSPGLLPWRSPLVIWQVVSHKFLRPLVPFAMLGALLGNLGAVLFPAHLAQANLFALTAPFNWLLLGLQMLFYALAWVGGRLQPGGALGKLLYLPTFLVNSNLAAVSGLYRFLTGRQTALWQRVARREDQP